MWEKLLVRGFWITQAIRNILPKGLVCAEVNEGERLVTFLLASVVPLGIYILSESWEPLKGFERADKCWVGDGVAPRLATELFVS